jgi:hypothetical protein
MSTDDIIIEEEVVTRIQVRHDTLQAWINSQSEQINKGNLAFGEFGLAIDSNTDGSEYNLIGRLGINETPTKFNNCPVVFMADLYETELESNVYVSSKPITYTLQQEEIPANSIVSWNAEQQKWEIVNSAVLLDSLPTQSGTLVYDSEQNSFSVGEIVFATDIDGGDYGGTNA